MPGLTIRKATAEDADLVVEFIRALAEYERLPGPSPEGEARIRAYGFGAQPRFEVLLAFTPEAAVGFALYFFAFSTFAARPTLYLEDLFVYPAHRGGGCGRALLEALARQAVQQGCGRMDWLVLDWNRAASDFYRALGARVLSEWQLCRLEGDALEALAGSP